MDIRDEKNHVFNIRLAKLTGLYQILDPGTIKYRGKHIYHIVLAFIMLYACIIVVIMSLIGLFCWTTDNISLSIDYFWRAEQISFIIYKIWVIVHHSDDIWNCLSITRYGFTSFNPRNRHVLDRWRERSVWITTAFTIAYFLSLAIYLVCTLILGVHLTPIKKNDGTVGYYRQNVMNLYLIVSDETYNAHFNTFYVVETISMVSITVLFVVFDILLVTLCLAMSCQMQMICVAFESVGHESLGDHSTSIDNTNEKKKLSSKHDLVYNEIKTIILDHQAVMKKYEDFLTLFGQVMLFHVFVSSLTLIILWIITILSFSDVERLADSNFDMKHQMIFIPGITIQILMQCYLFDNLHNQKYSILFALYSSNWTEMDMKCKKLILLSMKMNNANHKKLKFTTTKILNLEMFFKTMGNCYSTISVLINYIKANNE